MPDLHNGHVTNALSQEECLSASTLNAMKYTPSKAMELKTSSVLNIIPNNGQQDTTRTIKQCKSSGVHNWISGKEQDVSNYFNEIKFGCSQCKKAIEQIVNLINKKDENFEVCNHCKGLGTTRKCRKCNYIIKKFISNKHNSLHNNEKSLKGCQCPYKCLMQNLLEDSKIEHDAGGSNKKTSTKCNEYLNFFKSSTTTLQLSVNELPDLNTPNLNNENLNLLKLNKETIRDQKEVNQIPKKQNSRSVKLTNNFPKLFGLVEAKPCKYPGKSKLIEIDKDIKLDQDENSKIILKMVQQRKIKLQKDRKKNLKQLEKTEGCEELPSTFKKGSVISLYESESNLTCDDQEKSQPKEMVKGNKITEYHCKDITINNFEPLCFKVLPKCSKSDSTDDSIRNIYLLEKTSARSNTSAKNQIKDINYFMYKYQLSDKKYIDNGWTILPTYKIMRRMNIYKMMPAYPHFDWFEKHKNQRHMFYCTGEKLADIFYNGQNRWYYKNNRIALDYYFCEETNPSKRYVIYDCTRVGEKGKQSLASILAIFDHRGNGIVYDKLGNIRLKYNQSEGVIFDCKIGPPGRWKWHSLNDLAAYHHVLVETHIKENDSCPKELLQSEKDNTKYPKSLNDEMIAIELQNLLKQEYATKMFSKFSPFEIRMKSLQINAYFSLRIIDQTKIYLFFRDGKVSLKVNLGMKLISNEIIGTETIDV